MQSPVVLTMEAYNPQPSKQDREAPLPLVRMKRYEDYEAAVTKHTVDFVVQRVKEEEVEKPVTVSGTTTMVTETTKTTTKTKEPRKLTLKTYGHSTKRDAEHFFEALETFETELASAGLWDWAKAHTADVTALFEALEKVLVGTAKKEWHDVLGTATPLATM